MILYISTGHGVLGYDAVQGVPKKRVPYNTCLLFTSFLQKTQSNFVAVCLKKVSLNIY